MLTKFRSRPIPTSPFRRRSLDLPGKKNSYWQNVPYNFFFSKKNIIKNLDETLQTLVVPAILENESIVGLERGMVRHRSTSLSNEADVERESKKKYLDQLLLLLTQSHRTLILFGVDAEVIIQIFRQVNI